ncbi:PREDICTED: dnaJ homolog subfamily C member 12 isoform X1 [Nanorana parkeri]|uniref:dnaJ homolog subfamily C member 12 isoform X1 n=1 Tax=Nanorana parkeri TaxID=125878 RepID=UPI000854E70E|nr:PREDICTED: dnaJ homolog subfamily C member 12 isoform X1 [Nanorana parkeri]
MDAILSCTEESLGPDYYTLLGCDELSTVEQILAEYKVRALECHPDKHQGNQKAVEEFQKLQQAKDTLTNEDSRAHYDYWRRSKISIPFTQWEALQDSIKMSMHWAVKNKKEAMLEAPNKPSDEVQDDILIDAEEKKNPVSDENEDYVIEKPQENIDSISPKSPEESLDMTHCLLRFRWSAEAPSDLLRKFRNYEI